MKRITYYIPIVCLCLLFSGMSCEKFSLATDGKCVTTPFDLPVDSIYGVMGGNIDHGRHKKFARIEQLIKPTQPFVLSKSNIRICCNDSVNLEFEMKDVLGNSIDSIIIDQPTFVAFEIKRLRGLQKRPKQFFLEPGELLPGPFVRLIEKRPHQGDSIIMIYDFNQDTLMIKDKRFEELYEHCLSRGGQEIINMYGTHYDVSRFY